MRVKPKNLRLWLSASFDRRKPSVHHDQSLAQVFSDIKNGDKAAMHIFPRENKVFVLRGHETCDGRGHLLVWNEFLSIAQAINEGLGQIVDVGRVGRALEQAAARG